MACFRGRVAIITEDGHVIASADCQFHVTRNRLSHWDGNLWDIDGEWRLDAPQYRLRLADGREGIIVIQRRSTIPPFRAHFVGTGPNPLSAVKEAK